MDPVFAKAYKLLFSNEPDSAEQLRCMLDTALKQRYGNHKTLSNVLPQMVESDKSSKPATPNQTDSGGEESEESAASAENDEEDQLALDLLQEDLTCVVCKQINVGVKNQLVECLECHSLYHQECHQPPITDTDTSDPRLAWYCGACKKRMDKTLATIKSTTITTSLSSSSSSSKPNVSSSKGAHKKSSSSSSSLSSNSVSPADNPSSRSSTRSGKAVTPVFTIITADQRLQQMKKKAAAKKGHERGKLSK